jgi:MoaA/NifB/PqqE/SkfB family radical SAM enzyme
MEVREVLLNFLIGKHTLGQMLNLFKYFWGKKKDVVNWNPIYISVFPTFRCNLTCDMCLTHSKKFKNPFGQKPGKDVDFELFKQILNRYKNAIGVNLIGNGEPLFNKDLFRMIEYASKVMKMYTFSSSNGILVGDYIDEIINSPLTGFIISINGHNSTEFNRMTGMPGKWFDTICDNTLELVRQRNLKSSKLEILVSIILDKENYKHLNDMVYFGEKLGVDRVLFFQFLASPAAGFTPEERCLFSDDSDVVEALAQVNSLRSRTRARIALPPLLERTMNGKYCSVPFHNISVDGDGNVGGCSCQILDLSGNGKFYEEDAWNNAHFRELRRRFIEPEFPLLEPCRWCYNNSGRSRLVSNPNPLSYLLRQVFRRLQK